MYAVAKSNFISLIIVINKNL